MTSLFKGLTTLVTPKDYDPTLALAWWAATTFRVDPDLHVAYLGSNVNEFRSKAMLLGLPSKRIYLAADLSSVPGDTGKCLVVINNEHINFGIEKVYFADVLEYSVEFGRYWGVVATRRKDEFDLSNYNGCALGIRELKGGFSYTTGLFATVLPDRWIDIKIGGGVAGVVIPSVAEVTANDPSNPVITANLSATLEEAREVVAARSYGELTDISSDKGGIAWLEGEWRLAELEALCLMIRHKAGDGADGIMETLACWKDLEESGDA